MRTLVFDIGGTSVKYGLMDEEGRILERYETPTCAERGGEALMQNILTLGAAFSDIGAVGVSATGQIDPHTGAIRYGTGSLPGYIGLPVRDILAEGFSCPVAVLNDVNAMALGELHYGAAKGIQNLLCIAYGTGIGGAIVTDGKLYIGPMGNAGELGHFATHAGGHACPCGNNGCYEAYASTTALLRLARPVLGPEATGREVISAYLAGDARVSPLVEIWLDEVALGLCGLAHIFAPECMLLGGGIMSHRPLLEGLRTRLREGTMPSYHFIRLELAQLQNDAALYGAFWAAHHLL